MLPRRRHAPLRGRNDFHLAPRAGTDASARPPLRGDEGPPAHSAALALAASPRSPPRPRTLHRRTCGRTPPPSAWALASRLARAASWASSTRPGGRIGRRQRAAGHNPRRSWSRSPVRPPATGSRECSSARPLPRRRARSRARSQSSDGEARSPPPAYDAGLIANVRARDARTRQLHPRR